MHKELVFWVFQIPFNGRSADAVRYFHRNDEGDFVGGNVDPSALSGYFTDYKLTVD